MSWMTDWIWELLYGIIKSVCYIIDFIRDIFYMLAGIEPVIINGNESDILSHFLLSPNVKKAFLYILLIAIILLVIFTIIAIIRSEYAHGENKKSKNSILGKAFQSFIIFLVIPFILLAGITLTNTVMGSVNTAMNPYTAEYGGKATIGGQILVTCGNSAYTGDDSERIIIEQKFISGEFDYTNKSLVKQYYNLKDLDFFIGIAGSIVILVMFVMSSIMFIQRIFDVVLLYIISPISISTIPADDGNRFKLWREMIISKVLGAYGIILSMNLFFIIIPQIQSITFFSNSFQSGIVSILFIIGGAFAVTKSNLVIAQLTGSSAGTQETQQMIANMRTGTGIAKGLGATALGAGGAVLGGRNFISVRKRSGLTAGFKSAFTQPASKQSYLPAEGEENKRRSVGRIATMPLGFIKDLANGGLVGASKNFKGRLNNVIHGNSIINHSQHKRPKVEPPNKEKT